MKPRQGREASGARAFEGANNLTLQDVQITAVGGHQINITQSQKDDPMNILRRYCEFQATHESETAAYAPRCNPGTRVEVLQDIMSWTICRNRASPLASLALLWFSGPAGGGKTCIQREVLERCQQQGVLAASYFFSTRIPNLDTSTPFVATIAHQLCSSIEGMQALLEEVITSDPAVFNKSLDLQFDRLIGQPMNSLNRKPKRWSLGKLLCLSDSSAENLSPVSKVIIIDGLDECRDPQEQIRIIRLLSSAIIKYSLPLRIVIASRPEYEIRSTFDEIDLQVITHRIRLEDYGCDTDIEDYIVDSLFEIRRKHPSAASIPSDWPSKEDIQTVVQRRLGNSYMLQRSSTSSRTHAET
ncbi:hypothetical protein FA15DRAFT_500301 [Coprinopsis marcescibilis]|uniref:Nephrocystin 3-like N-terminal domain-containing protein n=1 Tax=Coprinopsis marcescibilis TaxID=230819 RepID=A0A5C3KRK7_COPMA|nr:hypothetical protein FA15DRAFT_500301 [Coprinopsis marcescibilis]